MPRSGKSKLRSREKRRQARDGTQDLQGAQASPEVSSPDEVTSQSFSAVSNPEVPQPGPAASTQGAAQGGAQGSAQAQGVAHFWARAPRPEKNQEQTEEGASTSQTPATTYCLPRDPMDRKAKALVQFLVEKFLMEQYITKGAMLKIINRKYKADFPEILKKASKQIEIVFGLDLQEVRPRGQVYSLVNKLSLPCSITPSGHKELPKTGLLIFLLGMIFVNGNRATEHEVWELLNLLEIYAGQYHHIFGDPKKMVHTDFVQEKYLEYRPVPNSDPPCYEFLWGPRAYAETSKMQVLENLAKIKGCQPTDFQAHYEEALKEEQENAKDKAAVKADATATGEAGAEAKAKSKSKSKSKGKAKSASSSTL